MTEVGPGSTEGALFGESDCPDPGLPAAGFASVRVAAGHTTGAGAGPVWLGPCSAECDGGAADTPSWPETECCLSSGRGDHSFGKSCPRANTGAPESIVNVSARQVVRATVLRRAQACRIQPKISEKLPLLLFT
ncbi:hypothetical protein Sviol_49500 [Streptomyces violascens]|uniref:Uncharacterized protein n=1 Tax=Streptomyces violascens TaxID=67381 RepID=A0ABQ3QTD1_9ACTN|nr:hypothetical protein Sviol_49500 [Streptomyces violascens]